MIREDIENPMVIDACWDKPIWDNLDRIDDEYEEEMLPSYPEELSEEEEAQMMNDKTKKLNQITDALRLVEGLIREFNAMNPFGSKIINTEIKDDVDPIKIQLYGGIKDIALEFRDMPEKQGSNYTVVEHVHRDNCVCIEWPEYNFDFDKVQEAAV